MVRLFKGSSGVVKFTRGFGQRGYALPDAPWLVVAWKELLEAFRDRRTMLNVVLLPVILMPVVISLPALMLNPKTIPPKILVVVDDPGGMDLARRMKSLRNESGALVTVVSGGGNFTNLILSGEVDLIVEIPKGFYENVSSGRTGELIYYYDPYGARSSVAMGIVQEVVNQYSEEVLRERLRAINVSEEYIRPVVAVAKQITSTGGEATTSDIITAMVLPMMVGLIAITGAGTFAIDMIAGERERKTLEALFTNPVSRGQLLMGKFTALTLLSLVSGLATLLSALIGVLFAVSSASGYASATAIPQLMEPSRLLYLSFGILMTVALGGLTGNAVMVTAASFAKTFKEAQQYVGFLTLVLVVPMIAIPYAPQSLYPVLRLLPVSSLAMFARDMIVNPGELGAVISSLAASILYLIAFLWLSARMFGRESVIFG